jgi:hypothetical protein
MRYVLVLAVCILTSACTTYGEAPPNSALTWIKPRVTFEVFVADVDACNAIAEAAGQEVEPRRGDPSNDLSPPIMAWRWLAHGADVDAAMAEAYEACFEPRGYGLAYVSASDARAFNDIGAAPLSADESSDLRRARQREDQLEFLHRLTGAELLRARLETRQQSRPLLSYVAPPSARP